MAPVAAKFKKQTTSPMHIEVLTPIEEENDEEEFDENDQPITMSKLKEKVHAATKA